MSIRAKTKKRLLILLACTIVVGGAAGALLAYRVSVRNAMIAESRQKGMEAYDREDWGHALNHLYTYTRRNPEDAEAMFKMAVCRRKVPMDRNQHIQYAISWFNSVLALEPGHEGAQQNLLELYRLAGQSAEGLELANKVLEADPKNLEALKTKAVSKFNLREFKEAKETAIEASKIKPDDMQVQTLVLLSMYRLDEPKDAIVERGKQVLDAAPDDPRNQMVMGFSHVLANDRENATAMLRKAAEHDAPDEEFLVMLVRQFDSIGLYAESLELIRKGADRFQSDDLERQYVRRLYENGKLDLVLARPQEKDKHSELLGLRAMALHQRDRKDDVPPIIEKLAERGKTDAAARAWEYVITLLSSKQEVSPNIAIDTYRRAIQADPYNPYIRDLLARVYLQTRETQLAEEQWDTASKLAPTWAGPFLGMTQIYSTTNRPEKAMAAAQEALRRQPQNAGAIVGFCEAMAKVILSGKAADPKKAAAQLIELLDKVQQQAPGEPNTLPVYVTMLAYSGDKAKATGALKTVLDTPEQAERLDERTAIRLSLISQEYGLGLDERLTKLAGRGGLTPSLAYAQAINMARTDKDAATKFMQNAVTAAKDDPIEWQAQWAAYLDAVEDPRGPDAWRALGDKYPDNAVVQQAVIQARSLQTDRAYLDKSIERLKTITGVDGVSWKIARARWLLGPDGNTDDAQNAINILRPIVTSSGDLIEPRLLLAMAYQRVDNTTGAVEQLEAAQKLQPTNLAIALQLAQMRLATGAGREARLLIDTIVKAPDATPEQLRQVAAMLAQLGELDLALKLATDNASGDEGDLLLAHIYLRQNKLEQAEQQFKRLMDKSPSVTVVSAYANLLRGTNRNDDAVRVLAHLKTLDLAPGVRELVLAEHNERFGDLDSAVDYYAEASKHERTRQVAYRKLVELRLKRGDVDAALTANDQALKAVPGDPVFTLVNSHKDLIRRSAARTQLQPMLATVINNAAYRDAAIQVLQMADKAAEQKQPVSATLRDLRRLADQNARFLELQVLMADWYTMTGRFDEAALVAARAMQAFPNDDDSAQRATIALSRMERWDEARAAALEWRKRASSRPLQPDLALAQAYLGLNQPAQALAQLEPYRTFAQQNPQPFAEWVFLNSRALIASGKVEDAARDLKPLISQDTGWRNIWLQLTMQSITDAATAEAWLQRLAAVTPSSSAPEWMRIADAWLTLGRRHANAAYRKNGMDILKGLYDANPESVQIAVGYAMNAYQEGDMPTAEAAYKRALQLDEKNAFALNNLAMLYVEQKRNLDEALKLAEQVVQVNPEVASFLDTLAQVQTARGEFDQAVASLNKAVAIDPEHVEWRLNLAHALLGKGDVPGAREQMRAIDQLRIGAAPLAKPMQDRVDVLRKQIADREKQAAVPASN